jgi:cytochrome c oxidase cbb3-type subunit 3
MTVAREPEQLHAHHTTGHEWDGIREFDRPLPSWWLWILWGTVIWSIGYWIAMPAWPLVTDYTRGVLGYSQRDTLAREMAAARAAQEGIAGRIRDIPLEAIRTNPELLEFALASGRSAFAVNCSQCHGQGAQGAVGYPNLNDDEWLWGGRLDDIHRTVRFGVRSGHAAARDSQMPAYLRDQVLNAAQVNDVAEFVLSLAGGATDAAAAARGRPIYAEQCVSCHGDTGQGNAEFGAPNLKDSIWLYGGDKASVVSTIANSRRGVMPAWDGRIDPTTLKALSVFVHSLGGGR